MNLLKEKSIIEAPMFGDDYCHYVNATTDQYSMCGLDVSKANWGTENDPLCPECEIRMENCGCDLCVGARNEY